MGNVTRFIDFSLIVIFSFFDSLVCIFSLNCNFSLVSKFIVELECHLLAKMYVSLLAYCDHTYFKWRQRTHALST